MTAGAGLNSSNNKAATISVRLRSAGKDSAPVSAIIERSIVLNAEQKAFDLNVSRSILSTIRIPVSKFGVLPPGFLASADLVLDFSTPETAIGQVAIAHFRASFA